MKEFFKRLKEEKDLRFDLFIGIWSAIIILIILSVAVYAIIYFTGNGSGELIPIETQAPQETEMPAATASPEPTEAPPTEKPTERPSYENLDIDEDDYDNDSDDDSSAATKTVYATTTVNVRSQANTSSASYGKLSAGESVKRIEKMSNGWSKIKYNGREAYVKSDYLSETKSALKTAKPSASKKPAATSAPKKKPAAATKTAKPKATKKPSSGAVEEPENNENNSVDNIIQSTQAPESTKAPENTMPPENEITPETTNEPSSAQ